MEEHMKFELKTYKADNKTVAKTYRSDRVGIRFGTVKGILKAIPKEGIDLNDDMAVGRLLLQEWENISPLFRNIFPGLTEEELDTCEIEDMIEVMRVVIAFASEKFGEMVGGSKN